MKEQTTSSGRLKLERERVVHPIAKDAFEFIVLIPLPTRSMLFMISAHDSIAMYLAMEPQSLFFYVIAASKRKSEFSMEAGSKYLILGAFSYGKI